MRGLALSLRFRRALIPAYVNANVKKMQHGRGRAEVSLSPPNPLPARTPFPDFREKNRLQ